MLDVLSMRLWAMQIFRIEIYYRTVALVALCCFYANTLLFFFHAKRWKSSLLCIFKKRLTSTFSQQVLVVSFSSVYRVHFNVHCVLWAWVILCNSLKKIYIYTLRLVFWMQMNGKSPRRATGILHLVQDLNLCPERRCITSHLLYFVFLSSVCL